MKNYYVDIMLQMNFLTVHKDNAPTAIALQTNRRLYGIKLAKN